MSLLKLWTKPSCFLSYKLSSFSKENCQFPLGVTELSSCKVEKSEIFNIDKAWKFGLLLWDDKIANFLICEPAPQTDVTGTMHTSPVAIIPVPNANTIWFLYNFSILRIVCWRWRWSFCHFGNPTDQLMCGWWFPLTPQSCRSYSRSQPKEVQGGDGCVVQVQTPQVSAGLLRDTTQHFSKKILHTSRLEHAQCQVVNIRLV